MTARDEHPSSDEQAVVAVITERIAAMIDGEPGIPADEAIAQIRRHLDRVQTSD